MTDFTATAAIRSIISEARRVQAPDYPNASTDEEVIEALRKRFQQERDEQLGRWRWPENPDYVVYPLGSDHQADVRIIRESDGFVATWSRAWKDDGSFFAGAGHTFFDAHPERKPWHNAKPGEILALGMGGGYHGESIAVVDTPEGRRFVWGVKGGAIRKHPDRRLLDRLRAPHLAGDCRLNGRPDCRLSVRAASRHVLCRGHAQ